MKGFSMKDFSPNFDALRMPEMPKIDLRNNINASAELFFENIREVIRAYEGHLDEKHKLVWKVACVNGKEYQVHEVGYINPSLVRFKAFDQKGYPCELLVHVASVQFILQIVEVGAGEQKQRIGFQQT